MLNDNGGGALSTGEKTVRSLDVAAIIQLEAAQVPTYTHPTK